MYSWLQRTLYTLIALMLISAGVSSSASAEDCSKRISIDELLGVLYKPENLHGSRGPTFLVQNAGERTKKKKIEIRDAQCRRISSFGLYATDWPYGARYYEKSGGSKHSAKQLLSLAKAAGSTNILVEGVKGKWIVVTNPTKRQGTIFDP